MIVFQYIVLFLAMLFILYLSGRKLRYKYKILSPAGITAIFVYTLNEGLRYGRGMDYNLYAMNYEDLAAGKESRWDMSFLYIAKFLINFDIPWQGYVLLMSFMFIFATLCLLRNYQELCPWALPLFVMFSIHEVENMVRWYMGFSFVLIGLSFMIDGKKKGLIYFLLYSIFACTFHVALAPVPIILYLVTLKKTPFFSPFITILLFFAISFSFQSKFMLKFVEFANVLSLVSERFENYGNDAEFWLTGGFAGEGGFSVLPDIQELLILGCMVIWGYRTISVAGKKYLYAYNLFIIGLLLHPIARQIELVGRFAQPFYFFRGIVLAGIIYYIYQKKTLVVKPVFLTLSLLIFLNMGRRYIAAPIKSVPDHYLYIWDSDGKSYESMYESWLFDIKNIQK
ncbi:MAG: EpsG family protein [Bacteroidaceae bacterium]|nr:EpsG family protein [Bacteroidaceae bacterium]